MNIFIAFLAFLSMVASATVVVLFYYLNKRVDVIPTSLNTQLGTLDEQLKTLYGRVDKNDERIATIIKWCETLRENQNTLQGDLEKAFYGTKKEIRKIERQQQQPPAEEKKSV